jgi:ComF family protein
MTETDSVQFQTFAKAPARPGLLSFLLDLLFPPRCVGCGRVDTRWCERCAAELAGEPVYPIMKEIRPDFIVAAAGNHTGKVRLAIHALKYEAQPEQASGLAHRLHTRLETQNWTIDMLIPVPLHPKREAKRGYNQTNLLVEQLAQQSTLPWSTTAIRRLRDTQSQVGLSMTERQANMQAAFSGDPAQLAGQNILIVDDVTTTGSTLIGCADAALNAGAQAVYGLTITVA